MRRFLITLFALLSLPSLSLANVDDDIWSYQFHLVYSNGMVSVSKDTKTPYTPIPAAYVPDVDPDTADYTGSIVGRDGTVIGRFGFMAPKTIDVASGRTKLEPSGPYFAYADRAVFFAKGGKKLFEISLRGSSFCNTDKRCDATIGENYRNCPMDCPAPIELPPPTIAPPIETSTLPNLQPKTPSDIAPSAQPATDTSSITINPGAPVVPKKIDVKTVLSFVGGILIIIFALVLRRVGKNME